MSNRLSVVNTKIDGLLNTQNDIMNSMESTKTALNAIKTETSVQNLEAHIEGIQKEINSLTKPDGFKYYTGDMTLEELIKANVYLDELTRVVGNLVFITSDIELIRSSIKLYCRDSEKSKSTIIKKYDDVATRILSRSAVQSMDELNIKLTGTCSCDNMSSCPYVAFYNEFHSLMTSKQADIDAQTRSYQEDMAYYKLVLECFQCLDKVFGFIKSNSGIFKKLPKEVFNDNFLTQFLEDRTIYNQSILTGMIDGMETVRRIESLQSKLETTKRDLEVARTNSYTTTLLTSQIAEYENKLTNIMADIAELNRESMDLTNTISNLSTKKENLLHSIEVMREIELCKSRQSDLISKLREMDQTMSEITSLRNRLREYRESERSYTDNIIQMENHLRTAEITLDNINNLEQEEIAIREKYDDVMEIRKAVSPVTGIPVEFIEYYVKSVMIDKINNLLDSVYHGRLRLRGDLVVVDDKEFTIPYQKNSTIVKDISKASDGERAILTFAFSLVLIQSCMDKYNIMLLDEIDTSLDHYGRSKFISLLETYMDTINSEQLFLVSHNNMFDSYPVNVIMTSEMNLSNMSNKSVIKLYS
jgi:hypothetical protein